jgi:hypothetical protein
VIVPLFADAYRLLRAFLDVDLQVPPAKPAGFRAYARITCSDRIDLLSFGGSSSLFIGQLLTFDQELLSFRRASALTQTGETGLWFEKYFEIKHLGDLTHPLSNQRVAC